MNDVIEKENQTKKKKNWEERKGRIDETKLIWQIFGHLNYYEKF